MLGTFARGLCAAGLALALSAGSAVALTYEVVLRVAEPGSPVDKAGQAILYFVAGRTLEATVGSSFNPFEIDGEMLLYSAGAFFFSPDARAGQELREGEMSILPQYRTPNGAFEPSAELSPIIPFAFKQHGTCYAGYVAGYPVPDTVYEVSLAGSICDAATVEDMVRADYEAVAATTEPQETSSPETTPVEPAPATFNPALPSDGDLELAVWAAYNGAYAKAMLHPDYLFYNGSDYDAVLDAIRAELAKEGLQDVVLSGVPATSFAATRACGWSGQTELRVAFTPDGMGIAIAAISSRRVYGYEYDPSISWELGIIEARDCATSGPGRASAAGAG